jgi:hypothetical protein
MKKAHVALLAIMVLPLSNVANSQQPTIKQQIMNIAASSQCARVNWKQRGIAPKAYFRGTALVYAKALCQSQNDYVKIASKGIGNDPTRHPRDSVAWYDPQFRSLGLSNANDGRTTLRNTYTLMIGLAQRESHGQYCVGRDRSQNYTTHDSAEAGLYQTSWGVRRINPSILDAMTRSYSNDRRSCLLEVFREGVSCKPEDAENSGQGPGVAWQELSKSCPAYATEYAAVVVRQGGGEKGEFGPIRKKAAELVMSCNSMLEQVENLVLADPTNCNGL